MSAGVCATPQKGLDRSVSRSVMEGNTEGRCQAAMKAFTVVAKAKDLVNADQASA